MSMNKIDEFIKNKLYDKKGTITNYTQSINKYFEIIGKKQETYFDSKPDYTEDIQQFWRSLENKAPKSKQNRMAAIKLFLKYYDKQTISLDIWETLKDRMKGKNKPVCEEHVPEIPDIKKVLEYCDIKTKTAILIGLSSGMRIGEVMSIETQDIHMKETPARVNIRAEIAKNGQRRTTFISSEAKEMLEEWLRVRDDYIKDAYKSLNFKNAQHVKHRKQKDPRIFPFAANVIQRAFNDAAEMAGFKETTTFNGDLDTVRKAGGKRERRTLHFHNMRKFFRSNFGNVDLAEHLMGHAGYLTEYRDYSDKRLAQEYLQHEHNLMISAAVPESIKQIQADALEKDKAIDELKRELAELKLKILWDSNGKKQ